MEIISWWRLVRFSLLLLGTSWLVAATQADTLPQVITETGPSYGTYPVTSIPAIGPAGSKVTDPAFGTTVMRLTDGSDGSTNCRISYSYWPNFNKDSTRIAVICIFGGINKAELFQFDPTNFTFSNRFVPNISANSDFIWSGVDPNVLFYRTGWPGGRQLTSYNAATGVVTLVRDFSTETGTTGSQGLNQMSRSINDDVWAFTLVDSTGAFSGYMVWKKSTNQILLKQLSSAVDEVQIDKSGRYLNVQQGGGSQVWDLQTNSMTQLTPGVDNYVHEDTGVGTLLSACGNIPGVCYRQLNTPHAQLTLLSLSSWSQVQDHWSMLADDDGWGLATNEQSTPAPTYNCTAAITLPFQCEISQVATDGSGRVRRLVHHNSTVMAYNRNAFGNISRDGKFIAWSSDWGNPTGRTDVYLAQIPPASDGSLPPPTNLRVVGP